MLSLSQKCNWRLKPQVPSNCPAGFTERYQCGELGLTLHSTSTTTPKYQLPRDMCAPTDRHELPWTQSLRSIFGRKQSRTSTAALPTQSENMAHGWDLPPFCPALEKMVLSPLQHTLHHIALCTSLATFIFTSIHYYVFLLSFPYSTKKSLRMRLLLQLQIFIAHSLTDLYSLLLFMILCFF